MNRLDYTYWQFYSFLWLLTACQAIATLAFGIDLSFVYSPIIFSRICFLF